jgi:DtxR family Mn-dependent transcriptional regulator
MVEDVAATLDSLEPGACGRFTRISDHDPEMLRYLAERGIATGDDFEVVDKQPFGGPLFVRFGHGDVQVMGGLLASAMRVDEASL